MPGSSSLRLGFLDIKILLCKISLKISQLSSASRLLLIRPKISIASLNAIIIKGGYYHQAELGLAAQEIVAFFARWEERVLLVSLRN